MGGKTILLLGATGTIGRAVYKELLANGFDVVAPVRHGSDGTVMSPKHTTLGSASDIIAGREILGIISCIASRNGLNAWDIDYGINSNVLKAAVAANVRNFVLLSAICVQKPRLAFQHAKRAFEAELMSAPLTWAIVRPTAFFKSLSGQVSRLQRGKPFLVFGNGKKTACKPISDRDTARYLVSCLTDGNLQNRVLPIGGPGPALTPLEQGALLFQALDISPRFSHVPLWFLPAIATGFAMLGPMSSKAREKAELARIGQYYASESMLLWDEANNCYDAPGTPEFGSDQLLDHYRALVKGGLVDDRGKHAVF